MSYQQEISATELKKLQETLTACAMHTSSCNQLENKLSDYGIYQQKDGSFMIRIRTNGGIIETRELQAISKVTNSHLEIDHLHLNSRQNIQLHNIPVANVYPVVNDLVNFGLDIRCGGGKTFRSISISPESGICPECIFDVIPYAKSIENFIFHYHDANNLPGRLKIAMSCSPLDTAMATIHDLGLIACKRNDEKGFTVYIGGGPWDKNSQGLRLFEFLPHTDILKLIAAVIDFFCDHDCSREKPSGLLYDIRKKMGDESFTQLFMSYYTKTNPEELKIDENKKIATLQIEDEEVRSETTFNHWITRACTPNPMGEDIVNLTLYVPNGNLSPSQFADLSNFLMENGARQLRIMPDQNIIIPYVEKQSLPAIFNFLSDFIPDLTGSSFSGMLKTCVGSKVCKTGKLDTPYYANKAAKVLDAHFADKPQQQAEMYRKIIGSISFSGCENSCADHQIASLGFQGSTKEIIEEMTDILTVFRDAILKEEQTNPSTPDTDSIKADDIETIIIQWLKE